MVKILFLITNVHLKQPTMKTKRYLAAALLLCAASAIPALAQTGLVGFATYSDMGCQGTTGGMGGDVVHVSTLEQLKNYAKQANPCVIIIDKDLEGELGPNGIPSSANTVEVASNKTILGASEGAHLKYIGFEIKDQKNIIIRNLNIEKASPDAIAFRNTHHAWVDHCEISSIYEDTDVWDGLLDFTYGSTYLTVSWCKFHDHDKTSICSSGTRNITDHGRQRVTYHHNAFIDCWQRNPRVGYGKGLIFNDYNENNKVYGIGVFGRAELDIENCYFKNVKNPVMQMYSTDYGPDDAYWGFYWLSGNEYEGDCKKVESNVDKPFDFSNYFQYDFAMDKASEVPGLVSKMGCIKGIESDIIPFPGDGAVSVVGSTTLKCGLYDGASYTIKIGEAPGKLKNYKPSSFKLKPSTTYYWQATIVGGPNNGKKSPVFRFTTAAKPTSFPMPQDGEVHTQLHEIAGHYSPCEPLTLHWREGFNDASYTVYLSENSDMKDAISVDVNTPSWRPGNLKPGMKYYWRVDTKTKDGSIVTGDVWNFKSDIAYAKEGRNEAENGVLGGLCFLEKNNNPSWIDASNGYTTVGDEGPGYISFVWDGEPGRYDVTTAFFDETRGQGEYYLFINEEQKDSWKATANDNSMKQHVSEDVTLAKGDEIRINFCTNANMRCRTDYIQIAKRVLKDNYTITVKVTPEEGGNITPERLVAKADTEVTFTAVPAHGYLFKNWTNDTGAVLSTNAAYTFVAKADREITANFDLKTKDPGYHSPKATDYDFEYVKTNDLTEQKTNAESGQLQWVIKQACSDWVEYGSTKKDGLVVSPKEIDIDPITDERGALVAFDGNNMVRVGATKYLILRLENTGKVKIYFTGGSSSDGVLTAILTSEDGNSQILNSSLEINKNSTPRSDALELTLDSKKKYSLQIGGTQDIAVYAIKLWP